MSTEATAQTLPVRRNTVRPRTDILETNDSLILVADVPGVDNESIELSLTEDTLTLRAQHHIEAPEGWKPAGSEFQLPDYERSFRLNAEIDRENLSATIKNGQLTVVLKKKEPRSNRIEVKGG